MAAALGSRRGCPHARPWTETLGVSFSADFRIQNRLGRRFSAYLSRLGPTRADSLESAHIRQAPLAQLYVRPYLVGAKKKLTPSVEVHGHGWAVATRPGPASGAASAWRSHAPMVDVDFSPRSSAHMG